jgi:hypothetical protein
MQKLRCTNSECESHRNDQHLFETSVTVDDDAEVAENLKRADAESFSCSFCGAEAELKEVPDGSS